MRGGKHKQKQKNRGQTTFSTRFQRANNRGRTTDTFQFSKSWSVPYCPKALFNPSTSGAKAFNATVLLREIEGWIDRKKLSISKKSGARWGVLVHGNRVLAAVVFKRVGPQKLSQPISDFNSSISSFDLDSVCEDVYKKMVSSIETHYPGKFLAVLFKNPSMSKNVFDSAAT
ncbi:hypothetical protein [Methyloversatilis sp. XJ19-49]|uniref:hypothetical protein n=1 Tax=Methyloversatilis sp. XJ19-49 TaxID=2963429 RepID=UPI00211B7496|nr:hypothetical protein [Methyloversatilis sp. XJ19-49]MCQ9376793.1 hypothetical protein [Methyloversatilis sp. XJ19-49]